MIRWRASLCPLVFLGLLLTVLAGMVNSQETKRIMIVLTSDTEGELNPCG